MKPASSFLQHAVFAGLYAKLTVWACFISCLLNAQLPPAEAGPVVKETRSDKRLQLYKSLVNGINKNLSCALTDSTEANWMDAFYSIELLRHKTPWVENKLHEAFAGIEKRSGEFQFSLMECVYDAYPESFTREAGALLDTTSNAKCFAACAAYLLRRDNHNIPVIRKIAGRKNQYPSNPVLYALWLQSSSQQLVMPPVKDLLHHTFFTGAKMAISFQRVNRNYPGLVIIRDSAGNFLRDPSGSIFFVSQLARSITNLPGYISNGNTPQGIFRMKGTDISRSIFIGPTPNIQLTMPGECSIRDFYNDSTIADSIWTQDWYRRILPPSWKNYTPFYGTYFAGIAGRTEIIAHGTTVDPNYYKGTSYFPFTPTLGCLCTKEIWDETTGRRKISDQQKLINAIEKAGGADGYYIVIELNDEDRPVTIKDILTYLE